jgi:prepilin-type processing-associated H-X9-DG protein
MRGPAPRRAFTLVEAIVVLCIIALLSALLLPALSRMKENARAAACLSNLRQIGAGLTGYLGEHEMTMPHLEAGRDSTGETGAVIDTVLLPYVTSKAVFACPSDPKYFQKTGTSYYWNVALNDQHVGSLTFLKLSEEESRIPVMSDKEGFHPYLENKVNMLYADGHVTKDLKFRTQ